MHDRRSGFARNIRSSSLSPGTSTTTTTTTTRTSGASNLRRTSAAPHRGIQLTSTASVTRNGRPVPNSAPGRTESLSVGSIIPLGSSSANEVRRRRRHPTAVSTNSRNMWNRHEVVLLAAAVRLRRRDYEEERERLYSQGFPNPSPVGFAFLQRWTRRVGLTSTRTDGSIRQKKKTLLEQLMNRNGNSEVIHIDHWTASDFGVSDNEIDEAVERVLRREADGEGPPPPVSDLPSVAPAPMPAQQSSAALLPPQMAPRGAQVLAPPRIPAADTSAEIVALRTRIAILEAQNQQMLQQTERLITSLGNRASFGEPVMRDVREGSSSRRENRRDRSGEMRREERNVRNRRNEWQTSPSPSPSQRSSQSFMSPPSGIRESLQFEDEGSGSGHGDPSKTQIPKKRASNHQKKDLMFDFWGWSCFILTRSELILVSLRPQSNFGRL